VVQLFLANGIVTRVTTFEVKATLMGDLNEWMTITLDGEHASTADVKEGVEQAKGLRPAIQELFRYDESWTGTEGSGGSGHSVAQEEAALVEQPTLRFYNAHKTNVQTAYHNVVRQATQLTPTTTKLMHEASSLHYGWGMVLFWRV
jgi:hypothetical protein